MANTPCFCENLSGYPKAYGIDISFKYMNPEYIICDEIGDIEEAKAITSSQHSGVPFIASAHADSFSSLLLRHNIAYLLENNVFDTVIKLSRNAKSVDFDIRRVCDL
jgi:stage III sporulation protein AA